MTQKPVSQLQVGDVFCREIHQPANPRRDMLYTVQQMQYIPIRDFYGGYLDTYKITAQNHLLGAATLNLGANEAVWVVD